MSLMDLGKSDNIEEKIKRLSESYVPEWKFTTEYPDIGSVIGILFAKQMAENIRHYNGYIDRCHLAYMNMLGISLNPPQPAKMLAVFSPIAEAGDTIVRKGTGIVADTDSAEYSRVIFEVSGNLCVTSSKISDIVISDKKRLLWHRVEKGRSVIFDADEEQCTYRQLELFHRSVFDVYDGKLSIQFDGNIDFGDEIKNGSYEISYLSDKGLEAAEVVEADGRNVVIYMKNPVKKILVDEDEEETFSKLVITQLKNSMTPVCVNSVTFTSMGAARKAEYVNSVRIQAGPDEFHVFGNELNVYNECYIGMDNYFSQGGALIVMQFELDIDEKIIGLRPQPEEDLKIIKKKKRQGFQEMISEAYAQKVTYEYYSEHGWKKLELINGDAAAVIFSGSETGNSSIAFYCPSDWQKSSLEGYYGRMLRIQLTQSENCYMQPCRHFLPVMKNLKIEYTYESSPVKPDSLKKIDLYSTEVINELRGSTEVFSAADVRDDALYIGFDKKITKGPVSIFFKFAKNRSFKGMSIKFEYSSPSGFKQMSVVDNTGSGAVSGTVVFMPPHDFAKCKVAGQENYYIKIIDVNGTIQKLTCKKPVIEDIIINAVEAQNLHTTEEVEIYIDNPEPDMKFDLGILDIYDAEVYVNETGGYTEKQMLMLAENDSKKYRVEYDLQGKIKSFFVLWNEVEAFLNHKNERAYIIDRINGTLQFGDGVNNPIPKVRDTSVLVRVRVCNGKTGNVGADRVEGGLNSLNSIANVTNPYPAYGGTDTETVSEAVRRGTHLMSSSNRLITARDFEQEVYVFSDNIAKVKCMTDREGHITLTLLMRDCELASNSFNSIKDKLHEHLLKKCEMTVKADDIIIREPVFAELSVSLWVKCSQETDIFTLQEEINTCLENFLKPVTGNNLAGWNIGEIPLKNQIIMKLRFLEGNVTIQNFIMNAKYYDETGAHETAAESLRSNPFVVVKSGRHEVHVLRS